MAWQGVYTELLTEQSVQAKEGTEFRHLWLGTVEGLSETKILEVGATTDVLELFAGELGEELSIAQLNANSQFYCIVVALPQDITKDNVFDLVHEAGSSFDFSTVVIPTVSATKDFATACQEAVTGLQKENRFHDFLLRFRKAADDETATDYKTAFVNEFSDFAGDEIGIVAPTTKSGHLGFVAGRVASIPVAESAAYYDGPAAQGVEIDSAFFDPAGFEAMKSLANNRAMILKTYPVNRTKIVLNDDSVMKSDSSKLSDFSQIRTRNKSARRVTAASLMLIKNNQFKRDDLGATMAAEQIGQLSLDSMKTQNGELDPKEIESYSIKVSWLEEGLKIRWGIQCLNMNDSVFNEIDVFKPTTISGEN